MLCKQLVDGDAESFKVAAQYRLRLEFSMDKTYMLGPFANALMKLTRLRWSAWAEYPCHGDTSGIVSAVSKWLRNRLNSGSGLGAPVKTGER